MAIAFPQTNATSRAAALSARAPKRCAFAPTSVTTPALVSVSRSIRAPREVKWFLSRSSRRRSKRTAHRCRVSALCAEASRSSLW